MTSDEECVSTHPSLGVLCQMRVHPHTHAHYACGHEPEGTHWSLFWWRPVDVAAEPLSRADQPAAPS